MIIRLAFGLPIIIWILLTLYKDFKSISPVEKTYTKEEVIDKLTYLQKEINAIPIDRENHQLFCLGQATAYEKSEDVIQKEIDRLMKGDKDDRMH